MRIEPVAQRHATNDRADIEKARSQRRNSEDMFRVQHSHDERGKRDEEDERKHDPRQQDREGGFFRGEAGSRIPSCGAKRIPRSVTALMKTRVRVATLLASPQAD